MGEGQPRIPEEVFREPSPEQEAELPALEHLEMYRLPGDPPLTERDVERYRESNAKFDAAIPRYIEKGMEHPVLETRLIVARSIPDAPVSERQHLWEKGILDIELALDKGWNVVIERAVPLIASVPEPDRHRLWGKAMAFIEQGVRGMTREYFDLIAEVPEEWQAELVKASVDTLALYDGLDMNRFELISRLPEAARTSLWEKITTFIERGLDDTDADERASAMGDLAYLPERYRARLLGKAVPVVEGILMNDDDPYRREEALRVAKEVPQADRDRLVGLGLTNKDILTRVQAMGLLPLVSEEQRARLWQEALPVLEQGLEDESRNIRERSLACIPSAPEAERQRFWQQAIAGIERRLASQNFYDGIDAMSEVVFFPASDRTRLIERGLNALHERVQREAVGVMEHLSERERSTVIASHPDIFAPLKELAKQTPLYGNHPKRFFSKDFAKSGSEITLLDAVPGRPDESLRERAIIRHIDALPYLAWRKAFEDAEFWKEKGFDYVPVEPIVSVAENAKHTGVDVATRVLKGPSLRDWLSETALYRDVLSELQNRIKDALRELGIQHGHTHAANFLVVFERDGQGEPDLAKPPQVYVIDFDAAASSGASRSGRPRSRKKP